MFSCPAPDRLAGPLAWGPVGLYDSDLAFIHDDGFGELAEGAAKVVIAELADSGLTSGTVVDLGCGSGITARRLVDAGYDVIGIDVSESLIEIARQRVPEATFRVGSFVGADVPPAVAVCAIGEVLNYGSDTNDNAQARVQLFASISSALEPGGLFLFDAAGPARAPDQPTRTFFDGRDWTVLVEVSGDDRVLKREITTFRRRGDLYRRASETHRLHLAPPEAIAAELAAAGLAIERLEGYGETALPPGLNGFLARKPPKRG